MSTIRHYNNWIPSLFDEILDANYPRRQSYSTPAVNVIEKDNGYTIEVAAAGMTKEDFQIHVDHENNLVISMEKKQEKNEGDEKKHYLRREFNYSKFQQTLVLPDNVDKNGISARVSDGVLTIDIPKLTPEQAVPKKLSIDIQ